MITLYHSPLTCSLASRLALIESGLAHEINFVWTSRGEHQRPEYLALNPAGKVPAMDVDGVIITESSAILPLIADLAPSANLLPTNPIDRAKAQSTLSYLSSTLHAAWIYVLRPERFTSGDTDLVRAAGLHKLSDALSLLERRMQGREYLLETLGVCDLYLVVFLAWRMAAPAFKDQLPTTPALDDLQARIFSRPALAAALAEELAMRKQG